VSSSLHLAGQIGIGSAMGSTVSVKSLSIAGTLTEEGTILLYILQYPKLEQRLRQIKKCVSVLIILL